MKLRNTNTDDVIVSVITIGAFIALVAVIVTIVVAIVISCLNYHYEYTTTNGETGTASTCYHQTGKVPVCWDGEKEIYDIKEIKRVRN